MKILVIIPAYNEEQTLKAVLQEVKQYEWVDIIVINDGSMDNTSLVAREMNVLVLEHSMNCGIGAAMRTGFRYALEHKYDIAVQIDADGQHDISMLNDLVSKVRDEGYDMAIGSRYITKTSYNSSVYRLIGIKYCSFLVRILHGVSVKDPTSGYRAVNKSVMDYNVAHYIDDYPEVPILSRLLKCNYRIYEVPVEMKNRQGGKSSISFFDSIIYFLKITFICVKDSIELRRKDHERKNNRRNLK